MKPFYLLLLCSLISLTSSAQLNDFFRANDDSLCVQVNEAFMENVLDNDQFPAGVTPFVEELGENPCFRILENGEIRPNGDLSNCCGDHLLEYQISPNFCDPENPDNKCFAVVNITVKCEKPECFVVDLSPFAGGEGSTGHNDECLSACENSAATYFIDYVPADTYAWSVGGGTYIIGNNAAEIIVTWGPAGSGSISLVRTTPGGQSTTSTFCVDILESPVAAFQAIPDQVCRDATVNFVNNTTGASDYYWDFGDGNSSVLFEPSHQYATPGAYTVTLYATRNNFDDKGNALCCCTDSTSVDVVVDSLSGPNIYWISTLCANDDSKYWTDAANCATYDWIVEDADGNPLTFDGQGTDTICVQWGDGPFGTISLEVAGCDDIYCTLPTVERVPIISTTVDIEGPIEVCVGTIATYTAPKWQSVCYDWMVTGGTILSDPKQHTITVLWGPAGNWQINLNYYSDFLGGLPDQDPIDCGGSASLDVSVKPAFRVQLNTPPVTCVNDSSILMAFDPGSYDWSVDPPAMISGDGTSNVTITWNNGPGTYVITTVPLPPDDTLYCNDTVRTVVQVQEMPPPDLIEGPTEVCPNELATYFVQSSQTGVNYIWSVEGGTLSSTSGNPVMVTWGPSEPYAISVAQQQLASPFCVSDTIQLNASAIVLDLPISVNGPSACVNTIQAYNATPPQHPDAVYNWTIDPLTAGSVISGQGTSSVSIQWNADPVFATIQLQVDLCSESVIETLSFTLDAANPPTITQASDLCPGETTTLDGGLDGGLPYMTYQWSTGATTQVITILSGGTYTLTVTDMNGCVAVATYTVNELPGPVAKITTRGPRTICTTDGVTTNVTLLAQTGPGYTFDWYCNNLNVGVTTPTFTHVEVGDSGTVAYPYWVEVTTSEGCVDSSNVIVIVETDSCIITPLPGCGTLPDYGISISPTPQFPNCETVDFTVTTMGGPVTVNEYEFDDGTSVNTSDTSITHTYTEVGCYEVIVRGTVPSASIPGTNCPVSAITSVCIPLAADFSYVEACNSQVTFTDLSTFLAGNSIVGWAWDFGDPASGANNTSTLQNPVHTFSAPGTYTVSLTVEDPDECEVTHTETITVLGNPQAVIMANPDTVCVGEAVQFMGSGTDILSWDWAFGDGASFGAQNPAHTYLSAGPLTVSLTVTDSRGCTGTTTLPILVVAGPAPDTIAYSPDRIVCEGTSVVLTAPSGAGYMYMWTTGQTTASITVLTSGEYGVKITDVNDCMLELDPVEIIVLPAPPAIVSGPEFICDNDCILLTAPLGYTYIWIDGANNPIPFETSPTLEVCAIDLLSPYSVVLTDAADCTAQSPPFTVSLAISPAFGISVVPNNCAGTPSTLTISPVQPGVDYVWNTGESGTSITVSQAGTYTAVGTDPVTGCRGTASATIYPQPDLCVVPTGCYEVCNPDTICGPADLNAYQWYLDGLPMPGETNQCLIVSQSGAYQLLGTNDFGCETTSDSLILEVINCGCENLSASLEPLEADSCCFSLSYLNDYGDLSRLEIYSNDADFDFNLSSLDPALVPASLTNNSIGLVSASGGSLPSSNLDDFLEFCLENILNQPQQIILDWYDTTGVVCSDTLRVDCPVEPECLYVASDTTYCKDKDVVFEMTVCNPVDADYPIAFIQILTSNPPGVVLTPPFIDETSNPIVPGECRSYNFLLSGPNLAGQDFCYDLVAHSANPEVVDTALCCSLDTTYCIPIPDCDPCDDIGVEKVFPTDENQIGECCYDVELFNNYAPDYFDGIDLCVLSPNTTISMNNPFGSGWNSTINGTQTVINLDVAPPLGVHIPLGNFFLPEICINTEESPFQLIEVKWRKDGEIVCRDTISLFCEPDCGYVEEEEIVCNSAGGWTYSGSIKNTSTFTVGEIHIVSTAPVGVNIVETYSTSILPGGSFSFNFDIDPPAMAGDEVCFTIAMHEIGHDDSHINCCNFYHCIELPDCEKDCLCDDDFFIAVGQGINCIFPPAMPLAVSVNPRGNLMDCDKVEWRWGDGTGSSTSGNMGISHVYPAPGDYDLCMLVTRFDINGEECSEIFCKVVPIAGLVNVKPTVYPNPAIHEFWIDFGDLNPEDREVRLYDIRGKVVPLAPESIASFSSTIVQLDISQVPSGLYIIEIRQGKKRWIEKLIIQRN